MAWPTSAYEKRTTSRTCAIPADAGSIRVSLCDRVHNARSTVNDLETDGPRKWERFNADQPVGVRSPPAGPEAGFTWLWFHGCPRLGVAEHLGDHLRMTN